MLESQRVRRYRRNLCRVVIGLIAGLAPLHVQAQYDGAAATAAWRQQAAHLIDANRRADIAVNVLNSYGQPISGASVDVSMLKHGFNFGAAVDPRYYLEGQSLYSATYKAKVEGIFNAATLGNHLKWKPWVGNWGASFSPAVTQAGLDWLGDRNMDVRGHTMIWPRIQSVPNSIAALLQKPSLSQNEKQLIYDATFDHIQDIGTAVAGKVVAWDVLNEPRTSDDVENALLGFTPSNAATITSVADLRSRWFAAAQLADPGATMFVNDFDILPGGDIDGFARRNFRNRVNEMLAAGADIDGLGFQSHFNPSISGKVPTGIPKLFDLLDGFQQDYGMPIHITEFDFNSTDLQLQADYTRDFLTAVFAHDAVESFTFWGFWEAEMGKPDAALFATDWSIKPNGQAYLDLVFDQWWTEESGVTDVTGSFAIRGFHGDYEVSVEFNGETHRVTPTLDDSGLVLNITIPGLQGDFDSNGSVDGSDFLSWQRNSQSPLNLADWESNFGVGPASAFAASVPEPACLLLLLCLGAGSLSTRTAFRKRA